MPIYDFTTGKFVNAPFQLVRPQSRSPILLTERILDFDDSARQSGLYILGKPRMGKSWFMVNLMIEDREKGHGIFFIDPHVDAIDKLRDNLGRYDLQFRTATICNSAHSSHGIFFIDPHGDVMRACIKELDTGGQTALQIIQEFVNFCTLLAEPENCIKVKSGQYTEREVNARTELDMIGERARELMALPKYTVYVKKLDSSRGTKIYKSTTKELPDRKADRHDIYRMINRTRETVCRIRRDIQDEIYNRQMPVIEESGPPSPYD